LPSFFATSLPVRLLFRAVGFPHFMILPPCDCVPRLIFAFAASHSRLRDPFKRCSVLKTSCSVCPRVISPESCSSLSRLAQGPSSCTFEELTRRRSPILTLFRSHVQPWIFQLFSFSFHGCLWWFLFPLCDDCTIPSSNRSWWTINFLKNYFLVAASSTLRVSLCECWSLPFFFFFILFFHPAFHPCVLLYYFF